MDYLTVALLLVVVGVVLLGAEILLPTGGLQDEIDANAFNPGPDALAAGDPRDPVAQAHGDLVGVEGRVASIVPAGSSQLRAGVQRVVKGTSKILRDFTWKRKVSRYNPKPDARPEES